MDKHEGFFVLVDTDSNKERKYYYTYSDSFSIGDKVIVETSFGLELGTICSAPIKESDMKNVGGFNQIIRICTEEDIKTHQCNTEELIVAKKFFSKTVDELKLKMKLVCACYSMDKNKLLFMYTSEERVDFRDLLKELSGQFKCRIELRQIGPRDRSKITGGIGLCGLPICCTSFLNEFDGISINMAKNQMLALNIQKISGLCGKLLCCLKFENENYSELKSKYPRLGTKVIYDNQHFKVSNINLLADAIKLENNSRDTFYTIPLEEFDKLKRIK